VQVQHGKANLRRALPGYNAAAQRTPWLVLVDLDQDFNCAAALVRDWLPTASTHMRFRIVVRQIESWLLADGERFSRFFGVRAGAVPDAPDTLGEADFQAGTHWIRHVGKSLHVLKLDVSKGPGQILESVESLAGQIRARVIPAH
jgi:hypothetical protein